MLNPNMIGRPTPNPVQAVKPLEDASFCAAKGSGLRPVPVRNQDPVDPVGGRKETQKGEAS